MPDTRTRAQKTRAVRQEELRRQLAAQKHHEHVIDLIEKADYVETQLELSVLKLKIDTKLALCKKYLPDLKAMEVTGEGGDRLIETVTLNVIKPTK